MVHMTPYSNKELHKKITKDDSCMNSFRLQNTFSKNRIISCKEAKINYNLLIMQNILNTG